MVAQYCSSTEFAWHAVEPCGGATKDVDVVEVLVAGDSSPATVAKVEPVTAATTPEEVALETSTIEAVATAFVCVTATRPLAITASPAT